MAKEKLIFISEDYSAVGRMSLSAAQAVMAAFDYQVLGVPTRVFSTQTEGFGRPESLNTDEWQQRSFKHWSHAGLTNYSAGLIGYIGQAATANNLRSFVETHQFEKVVVDPVMGDQNAFYPGIAPEYAESVQRLVKCADVVTPNLFELGVLIGHEVNGVSEAISELVSVSKPELKVVVTGVLQDNQVGVLYQDANELKWAGSQKADGHFYGTGDLFAALLTGYLTAGFPFARSVELSQYGTDLAVSNTASQPESLRKFGMSLSATLADVISNMQREK